MKAPFPIQPHYTGIAIAYKNSELIADRVLPRKPVGAVTFKYNKYALAESFTVPDTKVGRKSKPNEVEFSATELEASCEDHALDDPIPYSDIESAPEGYDPRGRAVEGIMDLVDLDREIRVANMVFALGTYPAANRTTLSGTSQWSDYTNSDPIAAILNSLEIPVMRPNVLYFGNATWTGLRQHPKIVKATNRNSGDAGAAARQAVAELFEVDEILVGKGFVNTARKGQTPVMTRVWGKHAAAHYRNPLADNQRGITFGITAQYGTRIAGSDPDKNIGMRGGERVRAGESVKELVIANDVAYFWQNAVA